MDIFTMVRANIKAHLGQFIGIVLMMIIAVTSILSFGSVVFSVNSSIDKANEITSTPDTTLIVAKENVTDDIMDTLKAKDEIESINLIDVLGLHAVYNSNDEEKTYHSQVFIFPDNGRYPLLKDNMTDFSDEKLNVKKGEVYFATGMASQIGVKPGDKVTLVCESTELELTFAGFIEDVWGSVSMGWKHVIVSQEDFDSFVAEVHNEYDEFGISYEYDYWLMEINAKDKSMSDSEINKIINKDTGIYDASSGSCTKRDSTTYGGMLIEIVAGILVGVAVILFVVLLVVISNNISTTVKTDYKTLGILKSQGFSSGKLRAIYLLQFLSAEVLGMIIGFGVSFALLNVLLNNFTSFVGVILKPYYSPLFVSGSLGFIILLSVVVIYICTGNIARISPHKAISEGRDDISFSSRIQAPIFKKALSATVAFRNITSSISQYIGIMITSLIMVLLLVFVFVGGQCLSSKNTICSVEPIGELGVGNYYYLTDEEKQAIHDLVASYTNIQDEFSITSSYVSLNDNKVRCSMFDSGSNVQCIVSGRTPDYDNEVVVGVGVINSYGVKIGDKITLCYNDKSYEYLIVGTCNTTSDVGNVIYMGEEAATHIGLDERTIYFKHYFRLENPDNKNDWYPQEKTQAIADEITEKYDVMTGVSDTNIMGSEIGSAISFAGYVVYVLAVAFVVIIVTMACTKCFNNERKQLGIYKAMGFTSTKLRTQFAFRFMIVFAIGAVVGLFIGAATVTPFFNLMFSVTGVARITIDFVPTNYIMPLIIICISAFIFAFMASRKVRKIDVNELIVE